MNERDGLVISMVESLWRSLDGVPRPLPPARIVGRAGGLPSAYAVEPFASAMIATATAAVAECLAARSGDAPRAFEIDRQHAAVAFRSERHVSPIGWELPSAWDPIAGDYAAADGWVRIHTNYEHHRDAALRALDVPGVREDVERAIALRSAEDVETGIVREGGAAAMLRTPREWAAHPQGRAVAAEPLILSESARIPSGRPIGELRPGTPPLAGIRVVDLTRVIAGPICTRFLAAYGAEVLRLDPPGFREVGALLPETTAGKRRAWVDLRTEDGRAVLERLVVDADLLICGYRSTVLDRLGLGIERLRAVNPALGILLLDAYGWAGPWSDRRGFDSLVQMSTGIATPQNDDLSSSRNPTPLPAQALDHGAGYLLAAAACRTLTERCRAQVATVSRLSLARVARYLEDLGTSGDPGAPDLSDVEPWRELAESSFGALRRVRCPGRIDGMALPRWDVPAGALGVDAPVWRT